MSKNRITLNLGDKERTLLFDYGTFEHIEKITGQEPLEFTVDIEKYSSMSKSVVSLVFAGLLTHCDEQKTSAEFSFEDVSAWVKRLIVPQILSIVSAWGAAKSVSASGEVSGDTQA